jgi:hypothetical protein
MGVVYEAVWEITEESPATGLFAKGTKIPAIVRISAATAQVDWSPNADRVIGMAIKLFPTTDEDKPVTTANLFTLDQFGLGGSKCATLLQGEGPDDVRYFRNIAPAKSLVTKVATGLFGRFDIHPDTRPLYPLTEVTSTGARVAKPVTPHEVQFYRRAKAQSRDFSLDARTELSTYRPGDLSFEIVIPAQKGFGNANLPVGKLTLGKSVISVAGDQELHFHHHPNKRVR